MGIDASRGIAAVGEVLASAGMVGVLTGFGEIGVAGGVRCCLRRDDGGSGGAKDGLFTTGVLTSLAMLELSLGVACPSSDT